MFLLSLCFAVSLQNAFVSLPSKTDPIVLYASENRDDLLLLHCKALKKAKKSIHLTIYALTDPHIIRILNKKAEEGVSITIYYDPRASEEMEKKLHPQIRLYPVVMSGLMHRKILITDHKKVFLGSANMTQQSLQIHGNLVSGIRSKELASSLEQETFSQKEISLAEQNVEVLFLSETGKASLEKLETMILTAKKTISVAMFTLTHPRLLKALETAHKKGVKVEVALDYHTAKGASKSAKKALEKAGIPLYIGSSQKLLHHKWVYIDEETLAFGSTNWTKAAFQKNKDCIVILNSLKENQRKAMNSLWKTLLLESQKVIL